MAGSVGGSVWGGGGARPWATGAYPMRWRRRLARDRWWLAPTPAGTVHFLADVAMVVLPAISLVSATDHFFAGSNEWACTLVSAAERLLRKVTSGHAVLFLQQSICGRN